VRQKRGQVYWRRRATSTKRHLTLGSEGRATIRLLTVTVVAGYRARAESLTAITCRANSATVFIFRTPAKLYGYETLLKRLAQDLQDMAAALGPFIQKEHAMVGQRHFSRHRHVASADQPRIRDGMVGRATWAGRDPHRAGAGEARDAVDTRGLKGLGQVIAGRMVVSRRASIDVPGTLGPSMKNL
jgi:hypothetical protein